MRNYVVYVAIQNEVVDFYVRKDVLVRSGNSAEEVRDQIRSESLPMIKEQCSEGRGYSPGIFLEIVVKELDLSKGFSMVADSDNLDSGSIGIFEVIDPEKL